MRGLRLPRLSRTRRLAALRGAAVVAVASALLLRTAAAQPQERRDFAIALGESVTVPASAEATRDLLAIGGDVVVLGLASGDAVAVGGDVVVRGRVTGDALALGGRVRLEGPRARVGGNAFALLGGVDGDADGRVTGRVRSLAEIEAGREPGYLDVAYSKPALVVRFLCLLFWILAALAATFVAPKTVARAAAELRRHPVRLTGIGALLGVSLGLTVVLAIALIVVFVGIPLLVLLGLASAALAAVALAASFHAVGERIAERLREGGVTGYAEVLGGALAFGVVHFVPVAGEIAWLLALLGGSGAVLATRLTPRRRGSLRAGD